MIPESFVQELLARVDIVELIDGYVRLKKAGANYAACCPFHQEKTPSFTVSPVKQFYHCFGCGAHGTAIGFVMAYSGLGFLDAVHELATRVGMRVPEESGGAQRAPRRETSSIVEVMDRAARYYYECLKTSDEAIHYLKSRGLSGEIARKFGIGYAREGWQNLSAVFDDYSQEVLQTAGLVKNEQGRLYDRFRGRIMFPIVNMKGETIAFGGRVLGTGEPKYLNSPETPLFEKGRELFGLPQARVALREKNTALVVEGYMDVVALAQHGVENVVATLGTATTPTHVQKLFRQVDRVLYCFDGDHAGRKAAWRALENTLEVLREPKVVGFVFLPDSQDPDSFIRSYGEPAFQKLLAEALPLSEFLLKELAQRTDMTSAEGRAQLIAEAKPLLGKLQTAFLRLQLVKRLAEASGFSQDEVERLCELKRFAPAAPPKAKSAAPSLYRHLLQILLQKPALARGLPLETLPAVSPEAGALRALCEDILSRENTGEEESYAMILERFRGHAAEHLLREAAAALMSLPLDEETIEAEFSGALDRLNEAESKRSFKALQEKAQKFGVAGLSAAEKSAYLAALKNMQTDR